MFAVLLSVAVEILPGYEGEVVDRATDLEAHLDLVMEELLQVGAIDPAIDASMVEGPVTFSLAVDAEDAEAAVHKAVNLLRTALHATGAETRLVGVDSHELVGA